MKLLELPSQLTDALEVLVMIIIIVLGLRIISWVSHRIRFRRGVPLVFHPLTQNDQKQVNDLGGFAADDLVPKLIAYIAEDPPGTLVPGGLGASAPVTSAEEPEAEWMAVLLTLAFARRPGFHVQLSVVESTAGEGETDDGQPAHRRLTVTVMIFRQPGGRVVAATTITQPPELIISYIGAYCVYQIGTQAPVRRRTPRWEQWHSADAYRLYRDGLQTRRRALDQQTDALNAAAQAEEASQEAEQLAAQLDAETDPYRRDLLAGRLEARRKTAAKAHRRKTRHTAQYRELLARAADQFAVASRPDPANLLPRLARAAILELTESRSALPLYKACKVLWPEQVEIWYRLAAHDPRHKPAADRVPLADALRDFTDQLRLRRILTMWLRTWLPQHWAPGERRYWASWIKPEDPRTLRSSMRTKRRAYRTATHVVMVLAEIWRLGNTELPAGVDPVDRRALSRHLFTELDHVLGDGDRSTDRALLRLFHPEQGDSAAGHQSAWHAKDRNLTLQVTPPNTRAAKRIGWLAHFNAACALSVAIKLPPESRPWDCEDDEWAMDCAAGALRQLAKVLRHPYSRLDPSWLRYDPDLEPLKELLHRLPRDHVFVELAATIGLPGPTPPELA